MNFKANWIIRGSQVELTSPGLFVLSAQDSPKPLLLSHPLLNPFHWVWLNVLKVSMRNWIVECSPASHGRLKFFIRAMSQLFLPGPVSMLRPILPNMPGSPLAANWLNEG